MERGPRSAGAWPIAWAASLLVLVALAGWGEAPRRLAPHLAPGRLAANGGLLLLVLVALMPLRRGGPGRLLEDLALLLATATPFAIVAADWTPLPAAAAGPYLAILASVAALAVAGSAAGVARSGAVGAAYLVALVLLLLGAPFLSYLAGELGIEAPASFRLASAFHACRPILLGRAAALPPGAWSPAVAATLLLAAGFAVAAALRRGRA